MPIRAAAYPAVRQYLRQLAPLSEPTWLAVAQLLEEKTFAPQAYFAKEGRHEHQVGIVLQGVFRSFIYSEGAGEFIKTFYTPIHYHTPQAYLGAYTALTTQSVNQVNIQAITQATALTCSYDRLQALHHTNPQVAVWFMKLSHLFFMGKEAREVELSTLTAAQRYARFRDQFPELEAQINQYYIAQYLGVTPTQLSRIRTQASGH